MDGAQHPDRQLLDSSPTAIAADFSGSPPWPNRRFVVVELATGTRYASLAGDSFSYRFGGEFVVRREPLRGRYAVRSWRTGQVRYTVTAAAIRRAAASGRTTIIGVRP